MSIGLSIGGACANPAEPEDPDNVARAPDIGQRAGQQDPGGSG
jgi:hypothetical protein